MEYEYSKIVSYGRQTDIRRYTRRPLGGRKKSVPNGDESTLLVDDGKNEQGLGERTKNRSQTNARSAAHSFRLLVGANLVGRTNPVLITLTYAKNYQNLDGAREHFKAFAKRAGAIFGEGFRYICVVEFQERGAIHFHTLCWGVPPKVIRRERRTRLVASLWGQGFADIKRTDGNIKLAGYMAKYFIETFLDARLFGRRAYTCSRNAYRPIIVKDAILAPHFMGMALPDLSTAHLAQEAEYDTVWLGRCQFKRYLTLEKAYATRG